MTAQALAGVLAGLLIAATLAAAYFRNRALVAAGAELVASSRAEEARDRAARAAARADGAERERDHLAARVGELQAELEAIAQSVIDERERRPLLGELVVVNTPRPDDQTVRGVCVRELGERGPLVLEAAEYIERSAGRGGEVAKPVAAGTVVIPVYSFAQIVQRTTEET